MSLLRATHLPTPCACPTLLIVLVMYVIPAVVSGCYYCMCGSTLTISLALSLSLFCPSLNVCPITRLMYAWRGPPLRVCVRVCVYTCACVRASACVCACLNAMCQCACTYAGVYQRAGGRVSVCVFPFYLEYVDRNKCHCLSLTTPGGCSYLFGYGTSRSNAMMFQVPHTWTFVCVYVCGYAWVYVYTAVCTCCAHTTHTYTHTQHTHLFRSLCLYSGVMRTPGGTTCQHLHSTGPRSRVKTCEGHVVSL